MTGTRMIGQSAAMSKMATVGAGAAATMWVGVAGATYRPAGAGFWGIGCPVKHVTGLDCPGCGSTRALGALTRLDLGAALDHNALVPLALVFVVASWALWTRATWTGGVARDLVRGPTAIVTIGLTLLAFTVLRNLDVGSWLASGLSS